MAPENCVFRSLARSRYRTFSTLRGDESGDLGAARDPDLVQRFEGGNWLSRLRVR
jgi:hypothetical protein